MAMKKFIKQIILFILIYILILGINFSLNLYFINTIPPMVNANTLIIGDSHPQTAINPKLLNNAENLSQSAEPYLITYFKLKKLLDTNKINTVILGYSYHNLSAFNDKKFIDSKWSKKMFQRNLQKILKRKDTLPKFIKERKNR